jgi:tetratricopeptide (TPR) repeat protein
MRWLGGLAIVLLGAWAFAPALHGTFVWDDQSEIVDHAALRDARGLWKIWFAPETPDYFPLKATVQWVQWQLWQEHTLGYHLTNLALHLASALLGGLLFAVHPVVVESVAWIAELKNTLSLPPLLLAAWFWLEFDAERRPRDYARALGCFLAAGLCKTSVVMFPVLLLVHAWWARRRVTGRDLRASAPFFAVSLALGLVTLWFQHSRATVGWDIPIGGPWERIAVAGHALIFYLGKCVWPAGLLPLYPRLGAGENVLAQAWPWLAFGVAGWAGWRARAGWGRHVLFGLAWFGINLLPVLGLVKMSYLHFTSVADHFVYLPLLGLLALAAAGAEQVWARADQGARKLAAVAAAAIVLAAAGLARQHAAHFASEEALWRHTLTRNAAAWAAHNNLGTALLRRGRPAEALPHFEAAVRLRPDYGSAHGNIETALIMLGRTEEALAHYREAVRVAPTDAGRHLNLAALLVQTGRYAEAIGHYEEALRLAPGSAKAEKGLAVAYHLGGHTAEAIAHYERGLAAEPDADTHVNLGALLAALGRGDEAIAHYQQALALNPLHAEAHYNLGVLLAQRGDWAAAAAQFQETLRQHPEHAEAHYHLGRFHAQRGDIAAARSQFAEALKLKPGLAEAREALQRLDPNARE